MIFDQRTNQVASGRLPSANLRLPFDRGNLPALLVGVARVLHWNPQASVVLRTSRAPDDWLPQLLQQQRTALELVRHAPDELVMMALPVCEPEEGTDLVATEASSWPGLSRARSIRSGQGTADADPGEVLMFSGTLVGRAATFWRLVDRLLPQLTAPLVALLAAERTSDALLATLYRGDGRFDVCRDLLARCPERLWVQEVAQKQVGYKQVDQTHAPKSVSGLRVPDWAATQRWPIQAEMPPSMTNSEPVT